MVSSIERGVGGVITPGPAKNSVYGDISYIIIIIRNLPLGPQQNLGKLIIAGKLSGPGLVLVIIK